MIFKQEPVTNYDSILQSYYNLFSNEFLTLVDKQITEEKWNGISCNFMKIDMYKYALLQAYLIYSEMSYTNKPLSYFKSKYNIPELVHNFACHRIDFDNVLALFNINFSLSDDYINDLSMFGYSSNDPVEEGKSINFKEALKYLGYGVEVDSIYINGDEIDIISDTDGYIDTDDNDNDQINSILYHNELLGLQGGVPPDQYYHLTLAQLLKLNSLLVVMNTAPTENTPGTLNQFVITNDYMYVCVKSGTAGNALWKRIPLLRYYGIDTYND